MARVHEAGRTLQSPQQRRSQDPADRLEERLGELLPALATAHRGMASLVAAAATAALGASPSARGICHGDATLDNVLVTGRTDPVGAENLCHLAGCSAYRWLFGSARGLRGRGMISGLWG